MEDWQAELQRGRLEPAWDAFVARYRRLVFAAIRRYAQDYDDVMDVFARVCEALREDDMRRLRAYSEQSARFSTWLVTVVHRLTIDWFRHRDGRQRLSEIADRLPSLQRRIFELVFFEQHSHIAAFELLRSTSAPALSYRDYLRELRATYRAVADGRRGGIVRALGGPLPGGADDDDDVDASADVAPERGALHTELLIAADPDHHLAA